MASISPSSVSCPAEWLTSKRAYLKFTVTSISDSDATTNKRYIGWKVTFEGESWVKLYGIYVKLGGIEIVPFASPQTTGWTTGQQYTSGNTTFNNASDGTLSLAFYMKQLFYYDTWAWNDGSYYQDVSSTLVCSKLPRYAAFTKHEISSKEINKFSVTWAADATIDSVQYSFNGEAWTNTSGNTYSITGLSPNTAYTIKTKIRRKDSQLWTESGTLNVTTNALPDTNTPSNFNLGSNLTASIANTNNLSKWYCDVYDGSTKIASSGDVTTTSKTITLTDSTMINNMLSRHPNDNSWTITVKYYCVSNGTTYTLTQRTCTCTIPSGSYIPTFNENNVSYVVTDSQSLNITGSNKKVIKGISDITVTLTPATPNGSATISSYNATSGSINGSTTNTGSPSINLNNVDGNSIVAQVVDSRNRTKSVTKNYDTFIDYFAPSFSSTNVSRIDGIGTNLNVNLTGKYCNWTGLSVTNIIEQVSIRYKKTTDVNYTTISGVTLNIVNNSGNFTISGSITGNLFNATYEYNLEITLKDKIGNFILNYNIPAGAAMLWRDMANKRIGINKKPTTTLDVNGNVNIDGQLSIKNTSCNVNGGNKANYPWHRIMHISSGTEQYVDRDYILEIKHNYNDGGYGRFKVSVRTNGTGAACNVGIRCLYATDISVSNICIGYWGVTGDNVYADVYYKCSTYPRCVVTVTPLNNITNYNAYTLYNSSEANDTTSSDKKTSYECYADVATAATELYNKAYTGTATARLTSMLTAYPIGAIYISAKPDNPTNIFGGTWTQLKNHFLFATNATSGNKGSDAMSSHTGTAVSGTAITEAQMPSHTHTQKSCTNPGDHSHNTWNVFQIKYASGGYYSNQTGDSSDGRGNATQGAGGHTHTVTLNNTGGGQTHNHNVSYIEVYVWQRTA